MKHTARCRRAAAATSTKAGTDTSADTSAGVGESEVMLDLLFDPILNCYYCPATNRYYHLKHPVQPRTLDR